MTRQDAALTVVIPAYNSQGTIEGAVGSALASGADEVIVVDDGSDDATAERARRAGARVIEQANAGASAARTRGAEQVATPFVVFLDADDELVPDGVQSSMELLARDESLSAVGGRVIGFVGDQEWLLPVHYTGVTVESLLRTGFSAWPPAAAVVRTASFRAAESVEPAALRPRFAEDFELLIRLALVGRVGRHDRVSMRYEMSGGKSLKSALRAIEDKEAIRRHYANALGEVIALMRPLRRRAAANKRVATARMRSHDRIGAVCLFALAYVQGGLSLLQPPRRSEGSPKGKGRDEQT